MHVLTASCSRLSAWGAGERALFVLAIAALCVCAMAQDEGGEKFVPGSFRGAAVLEMRSETSVGGAEVRLRHLCRWADADKATFEPIGDLVLFRLNPRSPFRTVSVDEVKQTLTEASVNLAVVRFAGATSCTAARTDVKYDERGALEQWIAAREAPSTRPALVEAPATQPASSPGRPDRIEAQPAARIGPAAVESARGDPPRTPGNRSLRDLLMTEAAERLNLPLEQLQFYFSPADEKMLALSEPLFKFNVKTPRNRNLGEVVWEFSIIAGDATQKAQITANVKAWQSQVVVGRPLAYRQVIGDTDLVERRTLADRLPEDPLVTRKQAIGQMAARELKPGTVLTARLIEATVMVKSGQLVTLFLNHGTVQVKTVARAMEQGTMGQTIRVKNESAGHTLDVTVTGPQTASVPSGAMAKNVE